MKMPKSGTKNALYEYFWARILKKLLSYLKSAPTNVSICKISRKMKIPKFRTKMEWFMYFWAGTLKEYCHIWNQHPRICLIAKFCEKNCLILGQKCLIWVFLRTKFQKLLLYLKSIPSNLSNRKIFWRNKNG